MDGFTFEQWVLFLAVTFRDRYRAVARRWPHLEERLPLARAGKLTVVQVNSGEAVHFIYTATEAAEPTACRSIVVEPPAGLSLADWALLHEEGYKRFVERGLAGRTVGHIVLFPGAESADERGTMLAEAERLAREHAASLAA